MLASVTSALAEPGAIVALHGPPGVGKTALALAAAEALRLRFPDGQLFVDLGGAAGGLTGADLVGQLLRSLGVTDAVTGPRERITLLRGLLTERDLLLVLDCATDEAQLRPALEARWPGVIVTSRTRLSALEHARHTRLPVLAEPDALRLLATMAPEQTAADPAGAAAITRLCGGLPLAVRVAGAKLAAHPNWRAATLAERLADERRTLDELSVGDHAVRASLDVGYEALSLAAARTLRVVGRLGRAEVEPWLVAAALDIEVPPATDALDELAVAELLDVTGGGYRVHDLTRVFARERFEATEPPEHGVELARRVALAYLAVAVRVEDALGRDGVHPCGRWPGGRLPAGVEVRSDRVPAEPDLVSWLAERRHGALAAVAAAHAEGLWAPAWALGRALCPVLEIVADVGTWRAVVDFAADAACRAGEPGWAAAIDAGLGTLSQMVGDWDGSKVALERAIRAWDGLRGPVPAAYARTALAVTAAVTGGHDQSALLGTALAVAEAHRDPVLQVQALRGLALQDLRTGDGPRGVRRLLAALELAGAGRLRASTLFDLGVVRLESGQARAAADDLQAALDIFEQRGDHHWVGVTLVQLGDAHRRLGAPARAVQPLKRAAAVFDRLGAPPWTATAVSRLGDAHRELEEHAAAGAVLTAAADRFDRLGQPVARAYVEVSLGELRATQGDDAGALAAFDYASRQLAGGHPIRRARAEAGAKAARARLAARNGPAPATQRL